MDTLRSLPERKWFYPALALAAGIAIGLFYAWWIDPVAWTDVVPSQLREDLREDYLRMVIDSYATNLDPELALERYRRLGEFGPLALAEVAENPGEVSPTTIQSFSALLELEGQPAETAGEEEPTSTGLLGGALGKVLVPLCGTVVGLGLLLAAVLVIRNRMVATPQPRAESGRPDVFPGVEGEYDLGRTMPANEPLATFRTIYNLGDDLYDDSFSIESPAGDFLGECGVGVGEIIGVGDPNKVSAFEVWLFDKNDIQTVTKVLMSKYAYNDQATRNRLAAKGDPVLADSGGVIYLETASLEVEARVVDLTYGEGALPPESFFERMTIELRAWPRGGAPR